MDRTSRTPDLNELARLFYASTQEIGRFTAVAPEDMPPVYQRLLAHEHHMTVTVEDFHESPVDVRVLRTHRDTAYYAREILLVSQKDGRVVQYGIMRVVPALLSKAVQEKIHSEGTPLGRILIEHNVLRRIDLRSLWRVEPSDSLQELLEMDEPEPLFGRTAMIYCDHEPAIELLEIVRPV